MGRDGVVQAKSCQPQAIPQSPHPPVENRVSLKKKKLQGDPKKCPYSRLMLRFVCLSIQSEFKPEQNLATQMMHLKVCLWVKRANTWKRNVFVS